MHKTILQLPISGVPTRLKSCNNGFYYFITSAYFKQLKQMIA